MDTGVITWRCPSGLIVLLASDTTELSPDALWAAVARVNRETGIEHELKRDEKGRLYLEPVQAVP
jgi:hypothetical protein